MPTLAHGFGQQTRGLGMQEIVVFKFLAKLMPQPGNHLVKLAARMR
jgi:hypothetical protein